MGLRRPAKVILLVNVCVAVKVDQAQEGGLHSADATNDTPPCPCRVSTEFQNNLCGLLGLLKGQPNAVKVDCATSLSQER